MLNKRLLTNLRNEVGIDALIQQMMTTSAQVAEKQRDLADLKHRTYLSERELSEIELSFQEEASQNGKNETERKAKFARLCMDDDTWQRVRQETDDTIHHRDMVQAEIDGLYARLSAQRHAANLIAATLTASTE